jgi:hypothetical protein
MSTRMSGIQTTLNKKEGNRNFAIPLVFFGSGGWI